MTYHFRRFNRPLDFALFGLDRSMPSWLPATMGDSRYPVLHIGPGEKHVPYTEELDWPEYDADRDQIPRDTASVSAIIVTHVMEHLGNPRFFLREAGRVLVDGGILNILVPHAQSTSYLQDLDHKTPYVVDTWKTLLDDRYYSKEKGGFPFEIGANFLFGLSERNLSLVTQLIRKSRNVA